MDAAVFAVEANIEKAHWWFVGRRRLFAREIARASIACDADVLDIGSGTGSNLRMLQELGFRRVTGLDTSEHAIRFCAAKGLGSVRLGDICAIPFSPASFDLVLATDVIEHVDDDAGALNEIARVLRPGGTLLLTVPAFHALWGTQDLVGHHKRRYRLQPLRLKIEQAGLRPVRIYYFNYLLFFPIWLARRLTKLLGIKLASEAQVNGPLLNRILSLIFDIDIRTAALVRPVFGVSILVVASR